MILQRPHDQCVDAGFCLLHFVQTVQVPSSVCRPCRLSQSPSWRERVTSASRVIQGADRRRLSSSFWRRDKRVWFSLWLWRLPSEGDGGLHWLTPRAATLTAVFLQRVPDGSAGGRSVSLCLSASHFCPCHQNKKLCYLGFCLKKNKKERYVFNKPWIAKCSVVFFCVLLKTHF